MAMLEKIKNWANSMFDVTKVVNDFELDSETSKDMIDMIKLWSDIFNGNEPWQDEETISLHVGKTMCEKVAKAVTIELKTEVSEPFINNVYQKFIRNIRKNTEYALGKSCIFFKPIYENEKIKISVIHGDKFIPVKFDDTGALIGIIIIDQITDGNTIYTRLEYNELKDNILTIKNICYKGQKNGVVLGNKIKLSQVNKWEKVSETSTIEGVNKIIGGFFTTPNANTVDNSSPLGQSIFANGIETLKEIDKQFSRTLWEYEGSELAIDVDDASLIKEKHGYKLPKGKKRLYRLRHTDVDTWNIFSPQIRDTSLFNGLNELLRRLELQCQLSFGTLSKEELIAKTATEIKNSKQDYYVTVSDIQTSLQYALEDLVYGIYVLCKLYNIPVQSNYKMSFSWDDSILVDKDMLQKQAQLELSQEIIDKVEYFIITRDWTEKEAIEFIKKMEKRSPKKENEEIPFEEE